METRGGTVLPVPQTTQRRHITPSSTSPIVIIDRSVYLIGFTVSISANGSGGWSLSIQDRDSTPMAAVPPFPLNVPGAGDPLVKTVSLVDTPLYMKDGIQLVMAGTPGTADIWLQITQPKQT